MARLAILSPEWHLPLVGLDSCSQASAGLPLAAPCFYVRSSFSSLAGLWHCCPYHLQHSHGGVSPREDEVNCGCSLVLDDAPPFCLCIDVISLSNVADAPIVIPSDIGLFGEAEDASLLMSFLGHGVKFTSGWVISGWS